MTAIPSLDCLCAGIVVADFICAPVARVPDAGGLVMTDGISLSIGGCAANVAVDLCKLGRRAAVAGKTGADVPGNFVRESLAAASVDTTWLRESGACQTSATLVINVRGEDRRFIHTFGANGMFCAADVPLELVRQARAVYVGGFLLMPQFAGRAVAELFRAARAAGIPTVLDVVIPDDRDWWDQLNAVLPWTDYFLPNVDEARQLTGLSDPVAQAARFRAAGARAVVITLGREGTVFVDESRRLRSQPFPVEFVDGTGSGDAFAAGFISGLLDGATPERCLEIGSALGASCVRAAGATTGVFTRDELVAFLATHRLVVASIS